MTATKILTKPNESKFRMGRLLYSTLVFVVLAGLSSAQGQQGSISTAAGGGPITMPKLNGAVSNVASTGEVGQIAWDSTRSVFYFTSSTFNRIYRYDPTAGQATVLAGNGLNGFRGDGGDPLQASFRGPVGLVLDPSNPNTLYVSDTGNNRVRRIDLSSNTISTISGDGSCTAALLTYTNIATASANVCAPGPMAMDSNGVLYVFDIARSAVWRMAGGQARIIAGTGSALNVVPTVPGAATQTALGHFSYLAVDLTGQSLYLNETVGLRQLNLATGILSAPLDVPATTPLLDQNGLPTGLNQPILRDGSPVAVDPSNGNVIYAIYTPVTPTSASVYSFNPSNAQKNLIAGTGSNAPPFLLPTTNVNMGAGSNGLGELVAIAPTGGSAGTFVASRSGWIHAMDSLSPGANFTTILGNGFRSYCGDGGPATLACLDSPTSVFAKPDGSFFIADNGNGVVRFVDAGGIIHSLSSPKAVGAPPTSLTIVPSAIIPGESLLFTSVQLRQVFLLDTATDTTTLFAGSGLPACRTLSNGNVFCDVNSDNGLDKAKFDRPEGLVLDPFGNPYLADPRLGVICLACNNPVENVQASVPVAGQPATIETLFGGPDALALDFDNGLLIAERGAQKIQRVSPSPNYGYVTPLDRGAEFVTDLLNNRQLPLPNTVPFLPVGITRIPGFILASDDYNRTVWSTNRPPEFSCPPNLTCLFPPPPPQVVAAFAGGGTDSLDNVPATQIDFGFRQVEQGLFDVQDSLGELASANVNNSSLVYITDRANNRIRLVDGGANRLPTANAGVDRNAPLDPSSTVATVLLDGSASSDPDGDVLSYAWAESGSPLGTGAFVSASLPLGKHAITLTVADSFGGTSSATVNINVTPPVDLAITATPSATTINSGDTLTYNATVTNNGPNDATGVAVALPILASTDFVSGIAAGGACTGPVSGTSGTVSCQLGNLTNLAAASVSISIKPHSAGTLTSSLSVSGDQGDPDSTNNAVSTTVTVNAVSTVRVTVDESIHIADSVTLLPALMLNDAESIHVNDAAAALPALVLSDSEQIRIADATGAVPSINTQLGTPTVALPDQNGNTSNVSVTFTGGVTNPGFTSVNISSTGPTLPSGFLIAGNPPLYYDVQTTAQYNAPIVVCITLNPMPPTAALLHFNTVTQQWEDLTIQPVPAGGPICTQVASLSPFAVVVANSTNRPPTANAGTNQIIEATEPTGASVNLSGSGNDPDKDPLSFTWSENGSLLGTGAQLTVTLPIGVHLVTLTVEDGRGGSATATVSISVQDTKAPVVTPPLSITVPATEAGGVRASAWPSLATFLAGASAADIADSSPVQLSPQVSGSSVDNGTLFGYGTTTVTFRFRDASGNVGSATATVKVILGTVKLIAEIAGQGRNLDGTYFVDLKVSNIGTGNARKVRMDFIAAVPTAGYGKISVVSPSFPMTLGGGSLDVRASQTVHVVLNVPATVRQFALGEVGRFTNVKGVLEFFADTESVRVSP